MSISSIDTITMAPRSVNAAELQGKEMMQNQNIGEYNAVNFQQQTAQQAQQTVETQESETEDYDKEDGNRKGASGQGNRKKKNGNGQPKEKMAPRSNSMFDIMI